MFYNVYCSHNEIILVCVHVFSHVQTLSSSGYLLSQCDIYILVYMYTRYLHYLAHFANTSTSSHLKSADLICFLYYTPGLFSLCNVMGHPDNSVYVYNCSHTSKFEKVCQEVSRGHAHRRRPGGVLYNLLLKVSHVRNFHASCSINLGRIIKLKQLLRTGEYMDQLSSKAVECDCG
jgi:hypothetical protein